MEILKAVRSTLTNAESEALRAWFEKTQCEQLREIARSKIREHSVAATNKALDSQEHNTYAEAASQDVKKAQRYITFLEVLQEIIATTANFEIVNVKS